MKKEELKQIEKKDDALLIQLSRNNGKYWIAEWTKAEVIGPCMRISYFYAAITLHSQKDRRANFRVHPPVSLAILGCR